jgi:hypothetical protein
LPLPFADLRFDFCSFPITNHRHDTSNDVTLATPESSPPPLNPKTSALHTPFSLSSPSSSNMTAPYVPANFPNTPTSSTTYSIRSSTISRSKPSIYDRNLNRSRGLELSHSAYTLLFAEMVTYAQNKVDGIAELERRSPPLTRWFY